MSCLCVTSLPANTYRLSQFKTKLLLQKPTGWTPAPFLNTTVLLTTYVTIALLPFASNTPSFLTITTLSRTLPFLPLLIPYLVPQSWGSVSHGHEAYSANISHFRTISTLSLLLHLKSTVLALVYNTPNEIYHNRTLLHPFNTTHRSAFNRGSTAIARLFGAVREHPAVGAVGCDVLLSGLSLGIWSGIRGLDAKTLLGLSIPFAPRPKAVVEAVDDTVDSIKMESEKALEKYHSPLPPYPTSPYPTLPCLPL